MASIIPEVYEQSLNMMPQKNAANNKSNKQNEPKIDNVKLLINDKNNNNNNSNHNNNNVSDDESDSEYVQDIIAPPESDFVPKVPSGFGIQLLAKKNRKRKTKPISISRTTIRKKTNSTVSSSTTNFCTKTTTTTASTTTTTTSTTISSI
jgi:hypothetical protein